MRCQPAAVHHSPQLLHYLCIPDIKALSNTPNNEKKHRVAHPTCLIASRLLRSLFLRKPSVPKGGMFSSWHMDTSCTRSRLSSVSSSLKREANLTSSSLDTSAPARTCGKLHRCTNMCSHVCFDKPAVIIHCVEGLKVGRGLLPSSNCHARDACMRTGAAAAW